MIDFDYIKTLVWMLGAIVAMALFFGALAYVIAQLAGFELGFLRCVAGAATLLLAPLLARAMRFVWAEGPRS